MKTILISGASRGIGAATAFIFAQNGWNVSLGMRNPKMPEWADKVDGKVHIHTYDAYDLDSPKNWIEDAVKTFGRIDGIVANAGIMVRDNIIDVSEEDMKDLMEVNFHAPQRLVKAGWEQLTSSGAGRVVIVASLSGKRVKSAISGAYSVSKYAALGLSHAIRHAGWDQGVRSTAMCPGFVATDMGLPLADGNAEHLTQPEDIAESIFHVVNRPNRASTSEFWVNCNLDDSY